MPGGATLRWQAGNGAATNGSVVFAAAYVTSDRWTRASLQVTGGDAASRRVWLDGARVGTAPVDLSQGKHFLLVERVGSGADAGAPLVATLTPTRGGGVLATSLDPKHAATFRELRDVVAFTDVALNSAGNARGVHDAPPGRGARPKRAGDGDSRGGERDDCSRRCRANHRRRHGRAMASGWPISRRPSVVTPPTRDVMMWEAESGAVTRVMANEPAARLIGWSPDGEWIYYTGTVRAASPDVVKAGEARRLTEVWQRFGTSPDKVHLFAVER